MNAFNDLFNQWQDVCYRGVKTFTLVEYVNPNRIILADVRQANAKLITSINRMRSEIERRLIEDRLDTIQIDVEATTKRMAQTPDASVRKQLNHQLNELTNESADLRTKMNGIRS